MFTKQQLTDALRKIDHKSYGMYKTLAGSYEFGVYILHIDHVQGDPFASPSRVRVEISKQRHQFPPAYIESLPVKTATEDFLLRQFLQELRALDRQWSGSGKSGIISCCHAGPEILRRIAVAFEENSLQIRFELGFPAKGRTILADTMKRILFETIPAIIQPVFFYSDFTQKKKDELRHAYELCQNQSFIQSYLKENGYICFIANGSILPRESGVSDKPLKQSVPFLSPQTLELTIPLPYGTPITGMALRKGITVITGGGYHGKSTLLKAMESGVYPHIAKDGREYVITLPDSVKIRAEDGRHIKNCNISAFINHLPTKQDTTCFSSENASGSTSQSANVMEAIYSGAKLLFIDEDTSATNFMIRDQLISQLVSEQEEPITPFIKRIRVLYEQFDISTVLVIGSSGDYLNIADTVLKLSDYHLYDVTTEAHALCRQQTSNAETDCDAKDAASPISMRSDKCLPAKASIQGKLKTSLTDSVIIDRETIDVRYLEQLCHSSQTIGIGYLIIYLLSNSQYRSKNLYQAAEQLYRELESNNYVNYIPKGYPAGQPSLPRKQELLAAINRFRSL